MKRKRNVPDEPPTVPDSPFDRPATVLYVDDGEARRVLARSDETVVEATGREALDLIRNGSVDCVVGTALEERLDGALLEATRERDPPIPAILLVDVGTDPGAALDAGVDDCVPADEYELLNQRVTNAVERYRSRRRAGALERQRALLEELEDRLEDVAGLEDVAAELGATLAEYGPIVHLEVARYDAADGSFARVGIHPDDDRTAFPSACHDAGCKSLEDVLDRATVRLLEDDGTDCHGRRLGASQRLAYLPIESDGGLRAVVAVVVDARLPAARSFLSRVAAWASDAVGEIELRTDRRQFRSAVEHAGHAVVITDIDGTIEYVNPTFEETTGYDREKAIGRTPAILSSGEHDKLFYRELWETILDGEVWQGEIVNERKDGTQYTIDQTIAPIRNEGGDIERFVAINRDVTERKERERILRRFRSAVEHAGHAVIITDTDGTIEYVNPAFVELSGYSAAEAIGNDPSILKSGEHDESFYRELWETILDGEVWRSEVVNERKDGTRYVVDQTIAPIADNGEPTGFVSINHDITDLKEYERELEEQNERLSEYGRMVAHDLRNPLTLLHGRVDELERQLDVDRETPVGELEGELEAELRGIEETAEYMHRLIDDLLSLAEQGQLVLDYETTSLEEVAATAWEGIDAPEAKLETEETSLDADPERLRELFSNLFRNAIEHGGDDVTVRVGPLDFDEGFYVEDDGPGIPEAEREKVFERGYTTDDSGTGFGLALVARIADAHRWEIEVTESSTGGARFEFRESGEL